jgi:hypothetical protein
MIALLTAYRLGPLEPVMLGDYDKFDYPMVEGTHLQCSASSTVP